MLADNLEVILKTIGINDIPQEQNMDNGGVVMEFPADIFPLIVDGIENVSFLKNAVRRSTKDRVICELRECVEGLWYRVMLQVDRGSSCAVSMLPLGKDEFDAEKGFRVRGGIK